MATAVPAGVATMLTRYEGDVTGRSDADGAHRVGVTYEPG